MLSADEILREPSIVLNARLRQVDHSTIPHQQREAELIRRELARRVGCAS